MPAPSIDVQPWRSDLAPLRMTFVNWRTKPSGREYCDVVCTDGTFTITLTEYSPSPMIDAGDTASWADDILSYIEAGRLDGEPGADDEYADVEDAHAEWAGKYMSPKLEDEDPELPLILEGKDAQ